MRTKKPKLSAVPDSPGDFITPSSEQAANRVTIGYKVDEKGNVDLSGMRSATKEQFKKLLTDKALLDELGIGGTSAKVEFPLTAKDVEPLFDILGIGEALIARRFFKVSATVANEAFRFTQMQKDLLCPGTAELLSKLVPDWATKWKTEIGLAIVGASVIKAQIDLCQFLMAKEAKTRVVEIRQSETSTVGEPEDNYVSAIL